MLRKSHSMEWQPIGLNPNSSFDKKKDISNGVVSNQQQQQQQQNGTGENLNSIHKHFNDLKTEIADFKESFAGWVSSRQFALSTDKEDYERTLTLEYDQVESLKGQLSTFITKRQTIVQEIQMEQQEWEECAQGNAELEGQKQVLIARLNESKTENNKLSSLISEEESSLIHRQTMKQSQIAREDQEISHSEERLGMVIDSPEENCTRFSFKYIDAKDWDLRCTLTLDVSTSSYRVKQCEPMIPQLATLIDELNGGDVDFFSFLRRVRFSFVEFYKK